MARTPKKKLWQVNPRAAIRKAKFLFFLEYSIIDIAEETGIPDNVLKKRAYKRLHNPWTKERREGQADLFRQAIEAKKGNMEKIVGLSTEVLIKFLTRQLARETEITSKDAKLVSDIIANVDRIDRLQNGEPTDIKKFEHLTPEEVKDQVKLIMEDLALNDPMMEFIGEESIYRPTGSKKPLVN